MTGAGADRMRGDGPAGELRQWPLPRGRVLRVSGTPGVMGIVNVTPDSFSDGGDYESADRAVHAALAMESLGAAIVDIGGESTRPGAEPVPLDQELARVIPVIEGIRRRSDVPISIDTMKAEVVTAALAAGADVVNDVAGLRDDAMLETVTRANVPVILMHMRGNPRTMQELAVYDEVVEDVRRELSIAVDRAVAAGVGRSLVMVDPGIGFSKNFDQNLQLLASCGRFNAVAPFVIGASRKGFIGQLTGRPGGAARAAGSLAAVAAAHRGGAAFVRVHDVQQTVDFLRVAAAIVAKECR